jgi:hypothetical protein
VHERLFLCVVFSQINKEGAIMPVLTSSDHLTTKSTLRHRPINPDAKLEESPRVPRASRTYTQKPSTHTTEPVHVAAPRSTRRLPKMQRLLLIGVGIGMILAVLLTLVGQLLIGWIGTTLDDLHYGRPRTYQVDAVVGHNDSATHPSHFIALNLAGQVEVIEFPAGDAARAKIYLGPHLYGANADLVPVTVQFVDIYHDHLPEMVVQVQGEQVIFSNAQGAFHAPSVGS